MTITEIILAGGKSSRIGQNKALLDLSGKKIIEIIYERISQSCNEIMIISNTPEDYQFMGLKIYKDIFPGLGPLAGIHSGLFNSNTDKNFIISCDLPLISIEAVEFISKYSSNRPAVIYKKGDQLQFLCGNYTKNCLPILEDLLKTNSLRVQNFIKKIDAEILDAERFPQEIFFNLNRAEDYEFLKEQFPSFQ